MEISDLINHSFSQAFNAIAKNGDHLQPFSYVIRYEAATVLGKIGMPHEQAVEHMK